MTLHEIEIMTGINLTEGHPPESFKPGHLIDDLNSLADSDSSVLFSTGVLHDNYTGVPEVNNSWEEFLQERQVFPSNWVGATALRLFRLGIEKEEEDSLKTGQKSIDYTYWARSIKGDSDGDISIEIGIRGGANRPSLRAIMARCAMESGLPSRDVSIEALRKLADEIEEIERIDNQIASLPNDDSTERYVPEQQELVITRSLND